MPLSIINQYPNITHLLINSIFFPYKLAYTSLFLTIHSRTKRTPLFDSRHVGKNH